MRCRARLLAFLVLPLTIACAGGTASSPTGPSGSSNQTSRVINVSGNLAFGDVPVGGDRSLSYTISNTGSAPLTITGTTISGGLASHTVFSFTNGVIAAGATQSVTVRFQPTTAGAYSGTVTVNGDQTGGTNTVAVSANATAPTFQGNWSGRYIVERCDGTGSAQDYFCSANRGAYPVGTDLPITMSLTQNASSVSGSVSLGQVTGSVTGSVNLNGTLILSGTLTQGTNTAQLTSWTTSVSGSTMTGNFTYNASLGGIPGVAVVVTRLSNVTRR